MKPLNYAILKYFVTVEEASADEVLAALKPQYGNFKAFSHDAILNALMTAEANAVLEESRFEFDENKKVRVYFKAGEDGKKMINKYIAD